VGEQLRCHEKWLDCVGSRLQVVHSGQHLCMKLRTGSLETRELAHLLSQADLKVSATAVIATTVAQAFTGLPGRRAAAAVAQAFRPAVRAQSWDGLAKRPNHLPDGFPVDTDARAHHVIAGHQCAHREDADGPVQVWLACSRHHAGDSDECF